MPSNAIFLSDVHLKDSNSIKSQLVIRFLQEIASQYQQIFILGDLFDVWPGTTPYLLERYSAFLHLFKKMVKEGHEVHYVEGNHDFKLGSYFSEELGVKTYPDSCIMKFGDKNVHMTHGDLGNPKEFGYRVLRKLLRSDPIQAAVQVVPAKLIFDVGARVSHLSRKYTTPKPVEQTEIKHIYRRTAERIFESGADVVLMGHTHLPDDVTSLVGNRHCRYINLGDWVRHFSYLEFDGTNFYTRTHPVKDL